MSESMISTWARAAISGTTPPNGACAAIWLFDAVRLRARAERHLLRREPAPAAVAAPSADPSSAMHWRQIGPPRAGRARALSGVPSQPNTFYIGFDNGGVWRSTDYGSNWQPLFDHESTGSVGASTILLPDRPTPRPAR